MCDYNFKMTLNSEYVWDPWFGFLKVAAIEIFNLDINEYYLDENQNGIFMNVYYFFDFYQIYNSLVNEDEYTQNLILEDLYMTNIVSFSDYDAT